jgi:hypothetical protein
MNPAEVQRVTEAVLRRAQRQGSIVEGEIREEIAQAGLPEADWRAVLSLLGLALVPEAGWYRYPAPAAEAGRPDLAQADRELLGQYERVAGRQGVAEPGGGLGPYPVRVRTETGQQLPALLMLAPSLSSVRLIAVTSLLGYKVRILIPRPQGGDVVSWDVRVLCAMRLADGLFETVLSATF